MCKACDKSLPINQGVISSSTEEAIDKAGTLCGSFMPRGHSSRLASECLCLFFYFIRFYTMCFLKSQPELFFNLTPSFKT